MLQRPNERSLRRLRAGLSLSLGRTSRPRRKACLRAPCRWRGRCRFTQRREGAKGTRASEWGGAFISIVILTKVRIHERCGRQMFASRVHGSRIKSGMTGRGWAEAAAFREDLAGVAPPQADERLIEGGEKARAVGFDEGRRAADRVAAGAQIGHDRARGDGGAD